MAQNIFISYSRREVGFIDELVRDLEKQKYDVWLDYRNLIPGTTWLDQVYKGIQNAEVILLVVSKASLASQNVEVEWRHVLEQKKRIILLIFEAVDLPTELEKYEWVDFRGNYQAGLNELLSQLKKPIQEDHPVPQTGFKIPAIVWVASALAVVTSIISLFAFWTLFIPWLLFPLPYRIFKRDFNFTQIQTALLILPIAMLLAAMTVPVNEGEGLFAMFFMSIPVGFILLMVLRSTGMQRWGKEQATMPKFANPLKPNNPKPTSVSFYVDYEPEDRKIAEELEEVLVKYGHSKSKRMEDAGAVFVLLSCFKSDSEADPENHVVFPLVLQTGEVSDTLSKIQWIDMRNGVRGLDAIAQLLPEPGKLLKALGNRPRGKQLLLPAPISAMYYFLVLLGVFVLGGVLKLFWGLIDSNIPIDVIDNAIGVVFIPFVITLTLVAWIMYFMGRSLVRRTGRLASFGKFTLALIGLGILLAVEFVLGGGIITEIEKFEPSADVSAVGPILFPIIVYVIGVTVMAVFLFFRRRDIMLWFPAKKS